MDIEQSPGIETRIQEMRGIKVMVDADLAKLYGIGLALGVVRLGRRAWA